MVINKRYVNGSYDCIFTTNENGKKIFLISTKGRIAWKMWGIMKCIYEFEAFEGLM